MSGRSSQDGPEHEPGEESGQAPWAAGEPDPAPPWASAQTQTAQSPPPWADRAAADRRAGDPPPPATDRQYQYGDVPPPPHPWASSGPSYAGGSPYADGPPAHVPPPAQPPVPPAWTSSPATPAYTPPSAPRRTTGRLAVLVAVMVLVAAGSFLGVRYLGRDHGGGGTGAQSGPGPDTGVSEPAPGTSPPASTASGSTLQSPSAPKGYRLAHDPVGYTLDVPEGWKRRQKQGEKAKVVFYDSPSDGRQLQIFELSESGPAESLDLAENDSVYGYSHQPGYEAHDRTSGDTWSELTYRYDDKDKGARQVIDHRFQAADGTLFAIRSSGPESLSAGLVRAPLTTAVSSFCPAGASCG
ncbi:hypothetical protein ABZ915_27620 [Streptomyces sp. NPDC046915]|uniref:hypothetical protein n=1 Tax=Streptomyces sp. NPDC046915 TaxID=3155257 RepID=UPI0033CFCEA5